MHTMGSGRDNVRRLSKVYHFTECGIILPLAFYLYSVPITSAAVVIPRTGANRVSVRPMFHSRSCGLCVQVASKVARLVEMDPKMRKIIHERNARKLKQANTHHWRVNQLHAFFSP